MHAAMTLANHRVVLAAVAAVAAERWPILRSRPIQVQPRRGLDYEVSSATRFSRPGGELAWARSTAAPCWTYGAAGVSAASCFAGVGGGKKAHGPASSFPVVAWNSEQKNGALYVTSSPLDRCFPWDGKRVDGENAHNSIPHRFRDQQCYTPPAVPPPPPPLPPLPHPFRRLATPCPPCPGTTLCNPRARPLKSR